MWYPWVLELKNYQHTICYPAAILYPVCFTLLPDVVFRVVSSKQIKERDWGISTVLFFSPPSRYDLLMEDWNLHSFSTNGMSWGEGEFCPIVRLIGLDLCQNLLWLCAIFLHKCIEEESIWGPGEGFMMKWEMLSNYTIQSCPLQSWLFLSFEN